jgi:ribonuclease J
LICRALALTDKGGTRRRPEVELIGIPELDAAGESMAEIAYDAVRATLASLPRARRRDPDETAESIRRAVRSAIAEHWGKKPVCHVHVLAV